MKDKITPTPWEIVDTPNDADFVADVLGKNLIGIAGIYAGSECSSADSSAIVSAVNNTIGENIRPESVPDLYRSLCGIVDLIDSIYPDTGVIKGSTAYLRAKDIIESAKL
jgi:hypothetical protein